MVYLTQNDDALAETLKKEAGPGYDVILDFLWGRPTEVLLRTLVPTSIGFARKPVRLVQIGEKAGPDLRLTADAVRTSGLEIFGGAARVDSASISPCVETVYQWMRSGAITMEIEQVRLEDIETVWRRDDFHGRRIVVTP